LHDDTAYLAQHLVTTCSSTKKLSSNTNVQLHCQSSHVAGWFSRKKLTIATVSQQ